VTTPLRLALADDQALVRHGLMALLGGFEQLQVTVEAGDGEALLTALATTPVDVILSDIRMPGCDGFSLLQRLRERGDATPVILLTTFDDPELPLRASAAGAQGLLPKDASPEVRAAARTPIAEALPGRTEWRSIYVVDAAADDASVRQEPYFVHTPDHLVWAAYTDARGELASEHVPPGDAVVWPASREPEY